jgi:hypothetical protein
MNRPSLKILLLLALVFHCLPSNAVVTQKVIITEFLALNSSIKADADGDFSDWVELYNPGETSIDLTGWHLTDDDANLGKWTFPSVNLGAGQYLLVWASGKDVVASNGELHTNFKLSGTGEYLAIVEPDTNFIAFEYAPSFPSQLTDISYGIYQGQKTSFTTPTPGAANNMGTQILSPVFSKSRGFYKAPFQVSLTVADPTAKIYYTMDGIRPSATVGNLYTGPLTISKTTPLSAVCVKGGTVSPAVTNTYFFITDIVNQPDKPAGYPSVWGKLSLGVSNYAAGDKAPADYGMDPDVCNNPAYKDLMDDALLDLPSLCIVTNPNYIFSSSTQPDTGGIYIYTGYKVPKDATTLPYPVTDGNLGSTWERPVSAEYYDPSDSSNFQINCGLRLHGGNSRLTYNSPKHGFTLSFRGIYGASKLNFDFFDEKKATNQLDDLVLRAGYNYSWVKAQNKSCKYAQYVIDPFSKKLLNEMGQVATHGKFIHLYINGLYWGIYEACEKLNKDFAETYFGGNGADYDVINDDVDTATPATGLVDGNLTAYNALNALSTSSTADPYVYNQAISQHLLAMINYADYMLMNFYIGNNDWDGNNWFIIRNRVTPGEGFNFTSWDSEDAMTDVNANKVTLLKGRPTYLFDKLKKNAEFKMLLADRIQKHFFNGGALSEIGTAQIYDKLAQKLDTAIIGESARWGDYLKDVFITNTDTLLLYTRNDHWIPKRNSLMVNYFPKRTGIVLNQLKSESLFPSLVAPSYNTQGGKITLPVSVTISAPAGTIYYTIDGTDPRLTGGALNSTAMTYAKALTIIGRGTLKARAKSGSIWSAINEVSFKSADTLHFIGDGTGLPVRAMQHPLDIYVDGGILHYQLPVGGNVRFSLYSLDGRSVVGFEHKGLNAGQQAYEFSQGRIQPGVYLYRMYFNDQIQTGKLMIR